MEIHFFGHSAVAEPWDLASLADLKFGGYSRDWLLETIEEAAEPLLQLNDDWEYRRLLEVYTELSNAFVRRLALRGLKSNNPEIKEAAEDVLEALDGTDTA